MRIGNLMPVSVKKGDMTSRGCYYQTQDYQQSEKAFMGP